MDTDLLKTFLEVKNNRHFGKAAENLYLTQAAVSARIKQLERALGAPLFVRFRNNLQLTATGERLVPHAEAMLIAWERAKQDVALKQDQKHVVTLGATSGLWDQLLQEALIKLYQTVDTIVIRAEAHGQDVMVRRLMERTMDLAFMYEPAKITDLLSKEVSRAELILVSSDAHSELTTCMNDKYVAVDWGVSFNIAFAQFFPDTPPPVMHTTLARIGLEFIIANGGCAYLPLKMVEAQLGRSLFKVLDAPIIQRPIFAAYHKDNMHTDSLEQVIRMVQAVNSVSEYTDEMTLL